MLDQVYPIPVPNGLEFITDRNRRFKQWRETTRELSSRFNEQMPSAFVSLIEYVGQIGVTIGRQETRRIWVDLESGSLGVIRSAFIAVNGDVTADTVEEISRTLRSFSHSIWSSLVHGRNNATSGGQAHRQTAYRSRQPAPALAKASPHPRRSCLSLRKPLDLSNGMKIARNFRGLPAHYSIKRLSSTRNSSPGRDNRNPPGG